MHPQMVGVSDGRALRLAGGAAAGCPRQPPPALIGGSGCCSPRGSSRPGGRETGETEGRERRGERVGSSERRASMVLHWFSCCCFHLLLLPCCCSCCRCRCCCCWLLVVVDVAVVCCCCCCCCWRLQQPHDARKPRNSFKSRIATTAQSANVLVLGSST